jgi:hypothetical protein
MVETLSELGKIKTEFDEKGKLKIPDDVENLFRFTFSLQKQRVLLYS